MALPPKLEKEIEELRSEYSIDVIEDAEILNVIFKDFPLGEGFNLERTDILLRVPRSYPDSGPDMFWTHPTLTLANGQVPLNADALESYVSKQWRRFSWHRQSWNPSVDNIHGNMEFIRKRLKEKK